MIEPGHLKIPIDRQCDLMGLSRSGYYYQPQGESALNQRLMNLLDEHYTHMPFYGVEKSSGRTRPGVRTLRIYGCGRGLFISWR